MQVKGWKLWRVFFKVYFFNGWLRCKLYEIFFFCLPLAIAFSFSWFPLVFFVEIVFEFTFKDLTTCMDVCRASDCCSTSADIRDPIVIIKSRAFISVFQVRSRCFWGLKYIQLKHTFSVAVSYGRSYGRSVMKCCLKTTWKMSHEQSCLADRSSAVGFGLPEYT